MLLPVAITIRGEEFTASWCQNAFTPSENNNWDPNTPLFMEGTTVISADVDRPANPVLSVTAQSNGPSEIPIFLSEKVALRSFVCYSGSEISGWCTGAFAPQTPLESFVDPSWDSTYQIYSISRPSFVSSALQFGFASGVWCSGAGYVYSPLPPAPSAAPSTIPSAAPSLAPTSVPVASPVHSPMMSPSAAPSVSVPSPSSAPLHAPMAAPINPPASSPSTVAPAQSPKR
jgi:hypothetical protein